MNGIACIHVLLYPTGCFIKIKYVDTAKNMQNKLTMYKYLSYGTYEKTALAVS